MTLKQLYMLNSDWEAGETVTLIIEGDEEPTDYTIIDYNECAHYQVESFYDTTVKVYIDKCEEVKPTLKDIYLANDCWSYLSELTVKYDDKSTKMNILNMPDEIYYARVERFSEKEVEVWIQD